MSQDYRVDERSDAKVRFVAKRVRTSFAILVDDRVDLIECLKKTSIHTEYGEKLLKFERCSDHEMANSEGATLFNGYEVSIVLPERTVTALRFGDGRARNTVAHEFGHAVMHQGPPMHRGVVDSSKFRWLPAYRSAEHQAKVFAPAFLVDDAIALKLGDETEVGIYFGISEESASIYLRDLRKPEERRRVAQKLREFSQDLEVQHQGAQKPTHFLLEPCPNCGQRTLFPVGIKYMCKTCDRVYDRFQDSDPIEF